MYRVVPDTLTIGVKWLLFDPGPLSVSTMNEFKYVLLPSKLKERKKKEKRKKKKTEKTL